MQQFHTARMLFLLGHLLLVEVQHLGNLFLNGIERIQEVIGSWNTMEIALPLIFIISRSLFC